MSLSDRLQEQKDAIRAEMRDNDRTAQELAYKNQRLNAILVGLNDIQGDLPATE